MSFFQKWLVFVLVQRFFQRECGTVGDQGKQSIPTGSSLQCRSILRNLHHERGHFDLIVHGVGPWPTRSLLLELFAYLSFNGNLEEGFDLVLLENFIAGFLQRGYRGVAIRALLQLLQLQPCCGQAFRALFLVLMQFCELRYHSTRKPSLERLGLSQP